MLHAIVSCNSEEQDTRSFSLLKFGSECWRGGEWTPAFVALMWKGERAPSLALLELRHVIVQIPVNRGDAALGRFLEGDAFKSSAVGSPPTTLDDSTTLLD